MIASIFFLAQLRKIPIDALKGMRNSLIEQYFSELSRTAQLAALVD
jgi:hypothetical protein